MIACGTVLLSIAGLDEDVDRDSSRLVLIVVAFLLQKGGGRSVNHCRKSRSQVWLCKLRLS
jgi:hypothetical protein